MKAGKYVKKKPKKHTGRNILLVILGICALILAMLAVDRFLGQQEEPTEATTLPTEPTLPTNPYQPEDFSLDEQGYMTCSAAETMLGIDVSELQREVDWQAVADAGIEFAFIRLGYRGYSEGGVFADAHAAENLKQARKAGLKIGAYFFSQALNAEEAEQEAAFCLNFLDGMKLDLPLVYDWEYVSAEARTGAMTAGEVTDAAVAFCEKVRKAGYEPMVYANWHQALNRMDLFRLQPYRFWLAMYDEVMDYPYRVDVWQYTETGSVPGIKGDVDLNLWLGS